MVRVICGGIHSSIIDARGQVWTYGCGSNGRLGHPDFITGKHVYLYKESIPKHVVYPNEGRVLDYFSSYYFNVCIWSS